MSVNHVTLGKNAYWCLHCGMEYPLQLPMSINMMIATSEAFAKDHKNCKPSAEGKARMTYTSPDEWARSWDTGVSSMTIYDFMTRGVSSNPNVPQDASDFGRCARLLAVAPEWRARLPALAATYPMWQRLVENWDRLTKAFEEKDFETLNTSLRVFTQEGPILR